MKPKPRIRYGILDDFGEVLRWVFTKPIGREYIREKRPSDYEMSLELGDGLF